MTEPSRNFVIPEDEFVETFVRASGPGGQNVNKLASAVQLRFDVRNSSTLPYDFRHRLERLAGRRLTKDGVIVITAQRFRSQDRNRQDARARIIALLDLAAEAPTIRRRTKPSKASKQRRLADKAARSTTKKLRAASPQPE